MKILADENMLMVEEMFSPYGQVSTFAGRSLTAKQVHDADVLLVRSVTKVNGDLLNGSRVTFVGSATIGVDHVDQHYLAQREIHFANATGCNANAVVEYVLSALFALRPNWMAQTVGIIGCGNVGNRLYQLLQRLGVDCRCYDPFLSKEKNAHLVTFDEVIASDVLCMHTPLTTDGPYPSYHLLNKTILSQLNPNALLLNAGRGAVVDNQALLALIPQRSWQLVLDVWENEPNILLPLLEQVDIATPHIAGYSVDGKINGTRMVRDAFCRSQGFDVPMPELGHNQLIDISKPSITEILQAVFDPKVEHERMKTMLLSVANCKGKFDLLRKTFPERLEFQHYRVDGQVDGNERRQLSLMGFQ